MMTTMERARDPSGARAGAAPGRPAATLRALILDFDGLILDTESPIFEAWSEEYRRHGHELEVERWQHALGTHGGFDPCERLLSLVGPRFDPEALREQIRQRNLLRCEQQPLLPGIEDLLGQARALGLGTAVASSSSRGWVLGWLERHRVLHLFDAVCARDDVARVKPAPDLFLLAAERLGATPASCLVFEDSPNGIRAARAAGMRCVAVPNAVTRLLPLPDPDLVLGSADELPLAAVAARVGLGLP
jgi:HAD superfamily hydrolase (TIGR01509 family)